MIKRYHFRYWLVIFAVLMLAGFVIIPISSQAAPDRSPQALVARAWRLANQSGKYHFSSRVEQKTYPAPTVGNVGQGSRTETIYLDGETDRTSQTLLMKMWQGTGNVNNPADAAEIRIDGESAYGRVGYGDWQKIDNFAGSFAPGNDLSSFLVAAKNVEAVNPLLNTHFTFDISGPVLAEHIRARLEEHLRQHGKLPAGLHLSASEQYRDAVGTGEVWLDADGLPLRLAINLEYPQQRNGERIEVQVQTDFSNFNRESIAGNPYPKGTMYQISRIQSSLLSSIEKFQKPEILLSFSGIGLVLLAILNNKSKKIYAAIVIVVILSMVVTPLLQAYQVHAFYQQQAVENTQFEETQIQKENERAYDEARYGSSWDPHQKPSALSGAQMVKRGQWSIVGDESLDVAAASSSDSDDDDGDGLPNDDDPCPDNPDCDEDGLTDDQESRLGTDPEEKDSDGDMITDNAEIAGFWYNNQWWYTNPLSVDTNNDGQLETIECGDKAVDDGEISPEDNACRDTDGDGTPDPFDRDDDGDGVPDQVDLSPYEIENNDGELFDEDHPLLLQVDGLQADEPAFVDFQLRPEDENHLWYALNVLDWPSNDEDGQIQRKEGNNSTFEDIAEENQPAAENASNGDMRLIPMLEIEMTGDVIPLQLTNPETEVAFSGAITATAHFEQSGDDISVDFDFESSGSYDVTINEKACSELGNDLYDFGSVSDGNTKTIADKYLSDLTKDEHGLILESGSDKYCLNIQNIVNGPYKDQMVDPDPLTPYNITVREKDNGGTLLAYVPLNMVADETGSDRVAFTGRMHYWPTTDDWGDTHKVNVVWVVQMLTDHKCNEEEDLAGICTEDDWVLDSIQVVRAYPETWYLTGMSVKEDHGVDIAVVYEDPYRESPDDRQYDDWLWTLAWGLDKSFMVGRNEDGDGERDITTDVIHTRWDYSTNYDAGFRNGDDELWGVPITATKVVTFAYDIADEYVKVAMTETEKILDDAFLSYVDDGSDAPTLLFTQESRYRVSSLGSEATTSETVSGTVKITVQIDPEKSEEQTTAAMSWAPYRYEDGEWESYPIDEYWDKIEVRYEDVFDEYQDEPNYHDIRRGQVFIAQMFYLMMYRGDSSLVQIGQDILTYHEASYKDSKLEEWLHDMDLKGGYMARVTKAHAKAIKSICTLRGREFKDMRAFFASVVDPDNVFIARDRNEFNKKQMKEGRTVVFTYAIMLGFLLAQQFGIDPLTHSLNSILVAISLWDIKGIAQGIWSQGSKWFKTSAASAKWTKFTSIGFLVGTAIAWGMFAYSFFSSGVKPGSLAGDFALATQIASTISAAILIAIAAIPIVGQIIAAIIGLFDALVLLICGLTKSENPVCRGISGWLAYGIRWVIYSGNIMIDLENKDRLKIEDFSSEFLDENLGMTVGNKLILETTTKTSVEHISWSDAKDWTVGAYWWQYDDDNLRSSTFAYQLEGSENDHHEDLSRNYITHVEWSPYEDGKDKYAYYDDQSGSVTLTEDGINVSPVLYLNESFAIPAQECWVGICYIRTERATSNINLGENMYYDVFPVDFDDFYDLALKAGSGYALAWSQDTSPSFPILQDADGDGLRSKSYGGADPDDSTWDTDGDRLSDYFEVEIGANPSDSDTDDDGLNDYDEVINETDVNLADTDYDGLTDKEELVGWNFVYDFADDGSQIDTWVTSDPLLIDADDDTLSDFQEKTYGFHPGVKSDPTVLTLSSNVNEKYAPYLLLRLDERENASSFSDQSGFGNNGSCSGSTCPASGHEGKYGNAPHFDGSTYIVADNVADDLTSRELTFGGWVYLEAGMSENGVLFAFNTANGNNLNMLVYEISTGRFYHGDSSANNHSASAFGINEWHHVMVVIDENDNGTLYVDGDSEATFTTSVRPTNDGKFSIGQEWDGGTASNFLIGYLDEVIVIPAALSESQVEDQMAGRYNIEDLTVRPGDALHYEATVNNELYGRYAEGLLSTHFPAAFSELPPQDFVLNPQEAITLSGTVDVGAAPSNIYTLTQEADALITDWQEDSDYAEALYHFSDTDTFLEDSSGNQPPHDGECSGHCPTLADGCYGNGAAFNGTDQYFTADDVADALADTKALSYGGWVYPESGMSENGIIASFHTSGGGNQLMLEYNPSAQKFMSYDSNNGDVLSASTFAPDRWYHVMVVLFEGDQENGYLYVNGVEEAQFSSDIRPTDNGRFSVGQEWDGNTASNFFRGYLDEIVVFPKALEYQEIQDLYNNPVFHLSLDEGSGATQFEDDSGFENDATCQGDTCPTAGEDGLSLQATQFDGSEYLTVNGNAALDLSEGDFAISTWVYPEKDEYKPSACGFVYQYFTNTSLYGKPSTAYCDPWPLDAEWDRGESKRSRRWVGTFYFQDGDHQFDAYVDEAYRVYVDGTIIFDRWDQETMSYHHDTLTHYLTEGFHTIKVEHRNRANVIGGKINMHLDISPNPLFHAQGILGGNNYPSIQRLGRQLKLVFNDGTTFITDRVLSNDDWNHVLVSYKGETNTLTVYVDGVDVAQYPVTGETPEAGQNFYVGQAADTASLELSELVVYSTGDNDSGFYQCTMDDNAEIRIQAQIDGFWSTLWAHDDVNHYGDGSYDLDVWRNFQEELRLRIVERDADEGTNCIDPPDDDPMGEEIYTTTDISPYETVTRYESEQGDSVDLYYTIENTTAGFEGKIDEVSIYKTALDAGQATDLYEAGILALHLPLNDPPGSSEFVDMGGRHNGACSGANCPTAGVPGRDEMALLFDGSNDTVTINDADTANFQDITIATWVRLNSLPGSGIMRFVTVGNEKAVLRYDDGDLHFYIKSDSGVFSHIRFGAALSTNEWFHVAGTYDGSTMRLYLDGTEVMTESVDATLAGGDLVRLSHASETLDGYLDDIRIYRRALTASQIEDLYKAAPEMLLLLDEEAGATQFDDFTDNGHTGTCAGNQCPDAGTNGQMGLSASFDGNDDYIFIPHDDALNPGDELTLAIWVKLEDTDPDQKLVGKSDGSSGYVLGVSDGQLHPELWKTGGAHYSEQWGQITAGYWTHLAFTFKQNGDLVGYINGNEVGRVDAGSNAIVSNTNDLRIGISPWNSSFPVNGRLDHVTLYTRELSPSEIREMFRLQAKWVEDRYHTPVKLDNDEPTSVLESDEKYRANHDVVLLVKADDATTYVTMMEMGVSTDGGATYTWKSVPRCISETDSRVGESWCPTFEPVIGEGQYYLKFRATDKVGNQDSNPTRYEIIVDDTPPEIGAGISEGEILNPDMQPDKSWLVTLSGTVADPNIGANSGSGVAEITVKLTDTDPVTDTLRSLKAEYSGSAWSIDYPLIEADPTGSYTLTARSVDNVGNETEFEYLVVLGVDSAPPVASLDDITAKTGLTDTITSTIQLTGRITETADVNIGIAGMDIAFVPAAMASLSNTLGIFHFDEVAGSTRFENVTGLGDATCPDSHCPTAVGEPGIWGSSVFINNDYQSDNNYLAANGVAAAYTDTLGLSFGTWVSPAYNPDYRGILTFNAANGARRNQIVHNDYSLRYVDGENNILIDYAYGGAHGVKYGEWYFVMVTIDVEGNGAAYLNGEQTDTFTTTVRPDPNGTFTIGAQWNGSEYDKFYEGYVDEVVVYNRVLSASEAYVLYAQADLSTSGKGVLATDWSHTISDTLNGLYQINLRPVDVYSNSTPRSEWRAWSGEIDIRGPLVDLQIVEEIEEIGDLAGRPVLKATTTYTCWAQDFNLLLSSEEDPSLNFDCPCNTVAPLSTVISNTYYHEASPWYAGFFTDTTRLYETTQTCTVLGLSTASNYIKACDAYGHCTSGQDDDPGSAFVDVGVLYSHVFTPSHNTIITSTGNITVEGKAYAQDLLQTVDVYADATPMLPSDTFVCPSATPNYTMTHWTRTWTATEGVHQLWTRVTDCPGEMLSSYHNIIYVDTNVTPPAVTISPLSLNRQHRLSYGRVLLKGSATDTVSGIAKVEISVDGSAWEEASVDGNQWRWEWDLGEEPDNAKYTVSARATDRAGWTSQITQTVTVDLDVPNPITMTLEANSQVITPGITIRTIPTRLDLSWEASEPTDKLWYYQVDWTVYTTETNTITSILPPSGPLTSTYFAGEAQRVEPQITSVFTDTNSQVDDWGPVYIDTPFTPDYVQFAGDFLPYLGWMDSGCSDLGLDRRVQATAQGGAALDDIQRMYFTWDSEGLRIAWEGANWDYNGDLFIYMDDMTDPNIPLEAYNPYSDTLEIDTDINIPGAKFFIWVQDSELAQLFFWEDSYWDQINLKENNYRFDSGLHGGHTDLFIPFDWIGISDPATTQLSMFAFATEEDKMALWATMPPQNPVNSKRVVDTAIYAGAAFLLEWSHVYAWPSLGPGVCPNLSKGIVYPYADSDLKFSITASPVGTSYALMGDDLFWLGQELTTMTRTADLSESFAFMDVEHLPAGDGETITYTISYENRGTYTATDVILQATSLYALQFTGSNTRTITATIGDINPGASGSIQISGYVDTTIPYNDCIAKGGSEETCEAYRDWAILSVLPFDSGHGPSGNPLDWLWSDHKVDSDPPQFVGILTPEYFINPEDNTFTGYAFDVSGVPKITLKADPPSHSEHQTECADAYPYDGVWFCDWNATTANGSTPVDGETFQIQVQATDRYDQASQWTEPRTYMVDSVPPTLTYSAKTTQTYSNTVINLTTASFSGSAGDNHGLGGAEICVDGACQSANVQMTGSSAHFYDDEPGSALAIGACGTGDIERYIIVTDTFTVGGASLGINIDHPKRDELQIVIESPNGITVTIVAPPEGTASEFANLDVYLNDAVTNGFHEFKADDNTAEPYYDRSSRPYEPLQAFLGEDSSTTWTLSICDTNVGENDGTYNRSRLVLENQNNAVQYADWFFTYPDLEDQDYISHTLTGYSLDLAGNRSTNAVTITFWIDNVAPDLTITESVDLAAITDEDSSVRVMTGSVKDGGEVQEIYAFVITPSGNRLSVQVGRDGDNWWFDLNAEETGEYTIWINAFDTAENIVTSQPHTITIIKVLAVNDSPTPLGSSTNLTPTVLGDSGYTFDWALGDGTIINDQVSAISHTYPTVGVFTATVTAKKGTDAFTGTTHVLIDETITGLSAINDSPTLDGETTGLTATMSSGSNVFYHWDYGDQQPSAVDDQAETVHRYLPGTYTATVMAINSVSAMSTTTVVKVSGLELEDDAPTYLGSATTFTTTVTSGTPITYTWDYGDQSPVISNPYSVTIHTYPAFGVYTATVRVDTTIGVLTGTFQIQILGITVVNDSPTEPGNATHFTATIEMDAPITYTWNLGGGTPIVENQSSVISHTYGAAGFYTAAITATNGTYTVTTTSDVIVDGSPPTSVITDPVNGQAITETTYILRGTASDDAQIAWVEVSTDNGTTWYTATDTTTWLYTWTVPIENGITHTLRSRAVDILGNVETPSAGVVVIVDNVPPTVTIRSPENGAVLTGTVQMITGTANGGAAQVEISTNGGITWSNATGISNWQFIWSLPVENSISHTLIARATDGAGWIQLSNPITVVVDNVAPAVDSVSPLNGDTQVNLDEPLVITFTEAVESTSLQLNLSPDPGGWSYTWDADHTQVTAEHGNPFTMDTNYTATVWITDLAGNPITAPYEWIFSTSPIDQAPPSSIITDPVEGQTITTTTYIIRGTASDDVQVDGVEISTDNGITWYTATGTTNWFYTWSVPAENGVTHTIRSRAVDIYGKIETPSAGVTVTVDVDTTAPQVISVDPPNGYDLVYPSANIVITFSESVQPASLLLTVSPDPGGWSYTWDAQNTQVTAMHLNEFTFKTAYIANVTVVDLAGNPLSAPFEWTFRTVGTEVYLPIIFR